MILIKTELGQRAFKERTVALTPRQRSAFILFDGKRTVSEVLAATATMGITEQDIQWMRDEALLDPVAGAAMVALEVSGDAEADGGSTQSLMERYQAAYLVATELTAGLGLRGLPLTLAVETTRGYKELVALAPKIRTAVGDVKYARLETALFG